MAAEGPHSRLPAACRFQEALSDFQLALAQLKDNATIDYTQLGLRFKLQAWEVSAPVQGAGRREATWPPGCRVWAGGPGGPSRPSSADSVLWVPLSCHCHRWGHFD